MSSWTIDDVLPWLFCAIQTLQQLQKKFTSEIV